MSALLTWAAAVVAVWSVLALILGLIVCGLTRVRDRQIPRAPAPSRPSPRPATPPAQQARR